MTDIIELAKKCGALELRIGLVLTKERLQAFEAAIRQDQIEKDASLFEGLYTDTCPGMNISNTIRKQLTKQVQGDV